MKKDTLILILLLLGILTRVQGQEQFSENYVNLEGSGNWIASSLLENNNKYYVNGGYSVIREDCDTYWSRGVFIVSIDSIGQLVNKKHYSFCEKNIYEGSKNSMIFSTNSFVSCGSVFYNDTTMTSIFIMGLDNDLDTIFYQEYKIDTTSKRALDITNSYDGGYVICGGVDTTHSDYNLSSTYVQMLLFKIDETKNIVWEKKYCFFTNPDYCYSYGNHLIQSVDSGYLITGVTKESGGVMRNFILKTDSLGNQQWVKFFGSSSYNNPTFTDIIETKDSCYIVCGAYTYGETFGGLYPYDGWLLKFDINGNLKWDKKYRDYVINNTDWRDTIRCNIVSITELNDKGFAGIAEVKSSECMGKEFRIYRFDSIGNLLWSKLFTEFSECNNTYHCNSIIQSDDGGFAISGHMDHYEWNIIDEGWDYSQRIFLIKTDSLGNDTLINSIAPYNPKPITNFVLNCYPNPATFEVFVEIPQKIKDDILVIYSTSGQVVHEQAVVSGENRIDLCSLKTGMYLLSLQESGLFGKLVVE